LSLNLDVNAINPVMSATKFLTVAQSISARSVHLKIAPAPSNIGQSREILKLLKGYGDVAMFRNLKYDRTTRAKDAIQAVFRSPESAADFLRASPIRFTLMPEKPYNPVGIASAGLGELFGKEASSTPLSASQSEKDDSGIEFEILADRAFTNHRTLLQRKRIYWGFMPEKTFVDDALKPDVPLPGLANMPPAHDEELHARLVRKKLEAVAARKTLRQMRDES